MQTLLVLFFGICSRTKLKDFVKKSKEKLNCSVFDLNPIWFQPSFFGYKNLLNLLNSFKLGLRILRFFFTSSKIQEWITLQLRMEEEESFLLLDIVWCIYCIVYFFYYLVLVYFYRMLVDITRHNWNLIELNCMNSRLEQQTHISNCVWTISISQSWNSEIFINGHC